MHTTGRLMLVRGVCRRQATDGKSHTHHLAFLLSDIFSSYAYNVYTGDLVDAAALDRLELIAFECIKIPIAPQKVVRRTFIAEYRY